jgi:hypothetical protein
MTNKIIHRLGVDDHGVAARQIEGGPLKELTTVQVSCEEEKDGTARTKHLP